MRPSRVASRLQLRLHLLILFILRLLPSPGLSADTGSLDEVPVDDYKFIDRPDLTVADSIQYSYTATDVQSDTKSIILV